MKARRKDSEEWLQVLAYIGEGGGPVRAVCLNAQGDAKAIYIHELVFETSPKPLIPQEPLVGPEPTSVDRSLPPWRQNKKKR